VRQGGRRVVRVARRAEETADEHLAARRATLGRDLPYQLHVRTVQVGTAPRRRLDARGGGAPGVGLQQHRQTRVEPEAQVAAVDVGEHVAEAVVEHERTGADVLVERHVGVPP
jgi:hypothetical protein